MCSKGCNFGGNCRFREVKQTQRRQNDHPPAGVASQLDGHSLARMITAAGEDGLIATQTLQTEPAASGSTTWRWWLSRLPFYNMGLIVAGATAWTLGMTLAWTLSKPLLTAEDELPEFTILTVIFYAVGSWIFLAGANLCYLLGPVGERVVRPGGVARYRKFAWRSGFVFSILVPFAWPALIGVRFSLRSAS